MAHSVGEQAARAVKNSEKKTASALRTPEERLKDIRNNLAAKLFVTPTDVQFLLELYDHMGQRLFESTQLLETANNSYAELSAKIEAVESPAPCAPEASE